MAYRRISDLLRSITILLHFMALIHANTNDSNYRPSADSLGNFSNTLNAFGIPNAALKDAADAADYGTEAEQELPTSPYNTEFLTYTAPEEDDALDVEQLVKLLPPQRVLFINTPEAAVDVLTVAEKQLESAKPLDIYVFRREAFHDFPARLRRIYEESRDRSTPTVNFVHYNTPAEAAKAQQAIRESYEVLAAASSELRETVVAPEDSKTEGQQLDEKPRVIFKIATRDSEGYQTYESE